MGSARRLICTFAPNVQFPEVRFNFALVIYVSIVGFSLIMSFSMIITKNYHLDLCSRLVTAGLYLYE